MGGGGKGGGSTSETKLPEWYEDAAKSQLAMANKVSKTGYVPYMGADVAAFSPQQVSGMQSAADWNAAFATPGQAAPSVAASLPKAQTFDNGLQGYSSYGGYKEALGNLQSTYPGLYDYIKQFSIDPVKGVEQPTTDPDKDPNKPDPNAVPNLPDGYTVSGTRVYDDQGRWAGNIVNGVFHRTPIGKNNS